MDKTIVKFELSWNPLVMGDFPKKRLCEFDGVIVDIEQMNFTLNQVITIRIDTEKHPNLLGTVFMMGVFTRQIIK